MSRPDICEAIVKQYNKDMCPWNELSYRMVGDDNFVLYTHDQGFGERIEAEFMFGTSNNVAKVVYAICHIDEHRATGSYSTLREAEIGAVDAASGWEAWTHHVQKRFYEYALYDDKEV